ncbi:MAG: amino acid adenylation domain-containing protein [Acidobacteriota bacterium]|nr:amino acid adenylation domain-containing protein [Acidobacteriota bacterium]
MIAISTLLTELSQQGIRLWAEGEQFKVRAAKGALTPQIRETLKLRKQEILAFLQDRTRDQTPDDLPVLQSVPRDADLPLSFAQQRLWFLDRLHKGGHTYNMPAVLSLHGRLDVGALFRAALQIPQRHESLRASFVEIDGRPVQRIAEAAIFPTPVIDLSALSESDYFSHIDALAVGEARRPFNLAGGPLLRALLFRRSPTEHHLFFNIHHIANDAWSQNLIVAELAAAYTALVRQEDPHLPPLSVQYADFAVWQRRLVTGPHGKAQTEWWREQLQDLPPELELPMDRQRPPVQSFDGSRYRFRVDASAARSMAELGRRFGTTPFMTYLAVFSTLMYRYTGMRRFAVGTPTANRGKAELQSLIGFFVNTLPLRMDLNGHMGFEELAARVRQTAVDAFEHADLPFERIVDAVQPDRSMARNPLFQVLFLLEQERAGVPELPGLQLSPHPLAHVTAKFDLSLAMEPEGDAMIGFFEYSTALFEQATIERMAGHFLNLVHAVTRTPETALADLDLMDESERNRVLVTFNRTRRAPADDRTAPAMVTDHAGSKQTALVYDSGDGWWSRQSYRRLVRNAAALADELRRRGIGPGSIAALYGGRCPEMVTAALAVTAVGAAYLPLDPLHPPERTRFMVEDSGAALILTLTDLKDRLPSTASLLCLDEPGIWEGSAELRIDAHAELPAYLIYTSGSTGRPKGVVIRHASLTNMVNWFRRAFDMDAGDRTTLLAGPAFDASIWEIWPSLTVGASLHLVPQNLLQDVLRLRDQILEWGITVSFQPTPLAEVFLSLDWPEACALRAMQTGGDRLRNGPGEGIPFVLANCYGPTENTVVATWNPLEPGRSGLPTIGGPTDNVRTYALDASLQPVPPGIAGELCLAGDQLAMGYHARPGFTASVFVPNPFALWPGERLYRTGDLVKWSVAGELHFLGRIDSQVKVRGIRVELGEVEAALKRQPGVTDAAALVHAGRLSAFVTGEIDPDELRKQLGETLTDAMVPGLIQVLPALPLSPSGKIDRRRLTALAAESGRVESSGREPRNETEAVLAGIWCDILEREDVGIDDNFFDLGGDSIQSIRIVARARSAGLDVEPADVFTYQTIAGMAEKAESGVAAEVTGSAEPEQHLDLENLKREHPDLVDAYALTPLQAGMLFHGIYDGRDGGSMYTVQMACTLVGPLDEEAFIDAWNTALARHDITRTAFFTEPTPLQAVFRQAPAAWRREDWSTEFDPEPRLQTFLEEDSAAGFRLDKAPLMRFALFQLGPERRAFVWTYHHILLDGWSTGILSGEVFARYHAAVTGREYVTRPLRPFRDYVAWLNRGDQSERAAFWTDYLKGFQSPTPLPLAHAGAKIPETRDTTEHLLTVQETEALEQRAASLRVTPGTLVRAAWALLLARATGRGEVVFGEIVSGRPPELAGVDSMTGLFINTQPVRMRPAADLPVDQWLSACQQDRLARDRFTHTPLNEIQRYSELPEDAPLVQSLFVFENHPLDRALAAGEGSVTIEDFRSTGLINYPLTIVAIPGEQLALRLDTDPAVYDTETPRRLVHCLRDLLTQLVAGADLVQDLKLPDFDIVEEPAVTTRRADRPATASYAAPKGEIQTTLARIWAEVLGLERVGVEDNFFELGGDSIISIQLVSKARTAGWVLSPKDLFDNQTIAALARVAERADQTGEQGLVTGSMSLAPVQRWFLETDPVDAFHFNQSVLISVDPKLSPYQWQAALDRLAEHHDALRLRFRRDEEGWQARFAEPAPVPLKIVEPVGEEETVETIGARLQASLNLERGPVFSACLFREKDRTLLLLIAHHLVVDGVSWRLLLTDLDQAAQGRALPPKTTSYKTWAQQFDRALPAGRPGTLPVDHRASVQENTRGAAISLEHVLPAEDLVGPAARAFRTRPDTLLLAALGRAACRVFDIPELVVDVEGHGRDHAGELDLSRTVGWFTTVHPLVLSRPEKNHGAWIKRVKEARNALPQQGIGALAGDIAFNYLGRLDRALAGGTVILGPASRFAGPAVSPRQLRTHLLELSSAVVGDRFRMTWHYCPAFHDAATIERLAQAVADELETLIRFCLQPCNTGVTPSDFPLAALNQTELDHLVGNRPVEDIYPLTPLQEGMLFHGLYDRNAADYFEQLGCTLRGELERESFKDAWRGLVARHSILRTSFHWQALDRPVQMVHPQVELPIHEEDLSELSAEEQQQTLDQRLAEDRTQPFALDRAPLMRLALYRLADDRFRFIWSHHHLLLDGWSVPQLIRELTTLYRGLEDRLPEAVPFRAYPAWLAEQDMHIADEFWERYLKDFAAPTPIPAALPPGRRSLQAKRNLHLVLDGGLTGQLRQTARAARLTLNTLVQGAWALLLARYADRDDVVFGTTVSGRPADLEGVGGMLGLFINTLPLRAMVDDKAELLPWLQSLQDGAAERDRFAYSSLADIQGSSDVPRGTPLFETLVVFENYPVDPGTRMGDGGLVFEAVDVFEQTNYPLTLVAGPGEELTLDLRYEADRFEPDALQAPARHLRNLLAGMAAQAERVGDLNLMDDAEKTRILNLCHAGRNRQPVRETLIDRFTAQAQATPDAVALTDGDRCYTYHQLAREAFGLARHLRASGLRPGDLEALHVHRSAETVIGILAILAAGGAYLPLDPVNPPERLRAILADARPGGMLAHADLAEKLGPVTQRLYRFGVDPKHVASTPPPVKRLPEQSAYTIYTSGSTGKPKGVVVTDANVIRLLTTAMPYYRFGPADVQPLFHSYAFDVSVWEIWGTLFYGGRLVVVPHETARDPEAFTRLVVREGVTILNQTPSAFYQFQQAEARRSEPDLNLRAVVFAGEALDPPKLAPFFARYGSRTPTMVNMYGITETTVHTTYGVVTEEQTRAASSLVGQPLDDLTAYLLDCRGLPVPAGVPGELYVAGPGVARGYLNRPALTAQRFIPNPFGDIPGDRLYRSGDLARLIVPADESWQIEYLGRIDHQVQLRGFRIETGEVSSVLAEQPDIADAAVLAKPDHRGEMQLVAYVVAEREPLSVRELRDRLAQRLPDYMIPGAFVFLQKLPLTSNGKLDRRALPDPQTESRADTGRAPRTPTEIVLAEIWGEVLACGEVGADGHFFELGGHSPAATRVASRIRDRLKVDPPLSLLFENPVLHDLATALDALGTTTELPIVAAARTPDAGGLIAFPLSAEQRRLWFLDRLEGPSATYNMSAQFWLHGPLDIGALDQALTAVTDRHETLRARFSEHDGVPRQWVDPAAAASLTVIETHADAVDAMVAEEAGRPFDLGRGPLSRLLLYRIDSETHLLQLVQHHIISDGWSQGVLVRDIVAAYAEKPLQPAALQYGDYATWQQDWLQGPQAEAQAEYWRQHLADAPAHLDLLTDYPRPAVLTFNGNRIDFRLDGNRTGALEDLAVRQGATLFMVLQAAFVLLLAKHSGQEEVLVGTPVAGRDRMEWEDLVGFFADTVVLRNDLSGNPDFLSLLDRIKREALAAFANSDLGLDRVIELVRPDRDLSRTPLFQALFVMQNLPPTPIDPPGLRIEPHRGVLETAKFELTLAVNPTPDGLSGSLEYNTALFSRQTAVRLADRFQILLAAITENPAAKLADLPLMDAREIETVTHAWNQTEGPLPTECVFENILRLAGETPDAPALSHIRAAQPHSVEETFSYARLAECIDTLAAHLVASRVTPGDVVGLHLQRTPELVIAILGAWCAGAAIVYLDPEQPEERRAGIAEETVCRLVLSDRVDAPFDHVLRLEPEAEKPRVVLPPADPDRIAYILYTSGSTGRPKGVSISHRALANSIAHDVAMLQVKPGDRITHFISFNFDAAMSHLLTPLCGGACSLFLTGERAALAASLPTVITEHRVTQLMSPTPTLDSLPPVDAPSLRCILVGGDVCTETLVAAWSTPHRRFLNIYGPTEATITATFEECRPGATPTIGRPVANLQAYILDARLQAVPPGVPGELCLGGAGLAQGYLNAPALTTARFVPNPFGRAGARIYRSGDKAAFLADGSIRFLGRIDHQVKVRGYRIEPGEIEAVLAGAPGITNSAVVLTRTPAGKRLVAFAAGSHPDLDHWLDTHLPAYMKPARTILLDALPLNVNGKLDRGALNEAAHQAMSQSGAVQPPQTETEHLLAGMFAHLLDMDRPGRDTHFFEAGGHSLLAVRLLSRMRDAFGIDIPLQTLFNTPTVSGLAESVEQLVRAGTAAALPGPKPAVVDPEEIGHPLSYPQTRLWFLSRMSGTEKAYNMPNGLRLRGNLDREALARAATRLQERQTGLRTTFRVIDGQARQIITPLLPVEIPLVTVADEAGLKRLAETRAAEPFDLENGPLWRLTLYRRAEDDHYLVINQHHLISDGWSMGILVRELTAFYREEVTGENSGLPELPVQYTDYARWQTQLLSGERLKAELDWWRDYLDGAPHVLEIPGDRARPPLQSFEGGTHLFKLSPALSTDVYAMARSTNNTVYTVMLACYAVLLARYTGQEDMVVGSPIANRERSEVQGLIGFFVNTLPIRLNLEGAADFSELLQRTRQSVIQAMGHQETPFDRIVEAAGVARDLSRTPLLQVSFTMENEMPPLPEGPGLEISGGEVNTRSVRLDLSLRFFNQDDTLMCSLGYATAMYDQSTVARFGKQLTCLLEQFTRDPGQAPLSCALMSREAQLALTAELNGVYQPEQPDLHPLHSIEKHAVERGHTPAVIEIRPGGFDRVLDFETLVHRAQARAAQLRKLGVKPGDVVAVFGERRNETIVAMTAAWYAGAAYLPLDVNYPRERLAYMLEDSGATAVLTYADLQPQLPAKLPWCNLDEAPPLVDRVPAADLHPFATAYVIYTSGSTGKPKGVRVMHGSLKYLLTAQRATIELKPGERATWIVSPSFDVSVWMVWGNLGAGAALTLVHAEMVTDVPELCEQVTRRRIDFTLFPTPLAEIALAHRWSPDTPLRLMMTGGDRLTRLPAPDLPFAFSNSYGPTENTVVSTSMILSHQDHDPPPIGPPLIYIRCYVLDKHGQVLPPGVPGELCLGGMALGNGYHNRPGLTADRFAPDPFIGTSGARMYRTGDLVRWLPDGNIAFLGRLDHQVKLRGYRIELGEIEAALMELPKCHQAAVLIHEGKGGNKQLVAYVVVVSSDPALGDDFANEARVELRKQMPEYMVPHVYMMLDKLPLTSNDKIDRRALLRLPLPESSGEDRQAPRTPTEEILAEIWKDLLGLEQVGVTDNFFEIGGHSLLATRVITAVRTRFNCDLPLENLFQEPTIAHLAELIDAVTGAATFQDEEDLEEGEI